MDYDLDFEHDQDVATRVSIHSHEEFEVKHEYNLKEMEENSSFKIECFIFVPSSLNFNNDTYEKEAFFRDLRDYIRFKTPRILIAELLSPGFVQSPLYQLNKLKEELQKGITVEKIHLAISELKTLGCILRARLRDYNKDMHNFLKNVKITDISEDLENASDKIFLVLKRLRELKEDYKGHFPTQKELIRYFQLTDEFLTNLIEFELIKLIIELTGSYGHEIIADDIKKKIKDAFDQDKDYRKRNCFRLHYQKSLKDKERYLYYMSQYKKALASVLYLKIKRGKPQNQPIHFIGGAAAFLASVFSFITMVWISKKFAMDTAFFILFASISYVFKDRIKEVVKLLVNPKLLSRFPDFDTTIFLQSDPPVKVGNLREKVIFIDKDKLDSTVLSIREETIRSEHLYGEIKENILLYQKEINFDINTIQKLNMRTVDIVDISRYNIAMLMKSMNEPDEEIYYYDSEEKKLTQTTGSRCYFINLIFKYTSYHQKKERFHFERYRVIVKKSGIEEIELVRRI